MEENIRIREVMSNMEKCGQGKPDQVDNQKLEENNRNHPANKRDESEFLLKLFEFPNFPFHDEPVPKNISLHVLNS